MSSTLDERFAEFRAAMEGEITRARAETIEQVTRILNRLRTAASDAEWRDGLSEAGAVFAGHELAQVLSALVPAPRALEESASDNQESRFRAQRFARVKVAELLLYYGPDVASGRAARDLYGALQKPIDSIRETFRGTFVKAGADTADYLHAELVRTLAHGDAELLGPGYPGPLV